MVQKSKIVRSIIWKLFEKLSSQAITLIVTILLARILLPKEFGLIAIIVVFIELANVIIDGGFSTALIQKKEADNRDFSTILHFSMGLAAILYVIFFFVAPFIAQFYNSSLLTPIIRVLSLNLFFNSFNAVQRAYISKYMLFDKLFYCSFWATLSSGVIGIVLAYNGFGVWALVYQQIVNQIVLTIIMWFMVKWRPLCMFSFERFKGLFDYGWKILFTNMIIAIYENARSLIIAKLYQPATLAFFDRGKQFPNLVISNINISLQAVLLPAFSDIQDERKRVRQMLRKSIEITNFFILPILVWLLVTAKSVTLLVLTDKWLETVPFMRIFCVAFMLIPIQSLNMSAINALGYSNIILKLEIIKKIIETFILVGSFFINIYAVAWGILLYNLICIAINTYPCKKILNYGGWEQLKDMAPYLWISVVMGVVICLLSLLKCDFVLLFTLQSFIGAVIYVGLNAVCNTNSFVYIKGIIKLQITKKNYKII